MSTPTLLVMLALSTLPAASLAQPQQHHRKDLMSNARVATTAASTYAGALSSSSAGGGGVDFPAGTCLTGCSGGGPNCAQKKWADGSRAGSYCIYNFDGTCASTENADLAPCVVYKTMKNCWDHQGGTDCTKGSSDVIVRTRTSDPSGSGKMCLLTEHWLIIASAPCIGIEDKWCNGAVSSLFAHGAEFAQQNAKKLPMGGYAMQVNAPDRRDDHQLHIHLAPITGKSNTPVDQILKAASTSSLSASTSKPSFFDADNGKLSSYAVIINKPLSQIEPFAVGAELHNHLAAAASTPYGVGVIPTSKGVIVFTTYRFSSYNYLSLAIDPSTCEKKGK